MTDMAKNEKPKTDLDEMREEFAKIKPPPPDESPSSKYPADPTGNAK